VENYILNLKHEHRTWGARSERLIRRFSEIKIPANSTIHALLHRHRFLGRQAAKSSCVILPTDWKPYGISRYCKLRDVRIERRNQTTCSVLRRFARIGPHRFRKLLTAFIVIGMFAGVMSVSAGGIFHLGSFSSLRLAQAARKLTYSIFDERFQGLAYAAAMLLWMGAVPASQRLTRFLAYPGRPSLTNYVVQIAILEILFASSHPISPLNRWGTLVGVVLFFGLQIAFSRWWIVRFRYGRLEWLWRSVTFARSEPLRREQARVAARPSMNSLETLRSW
jgi:Protein of unknown function (DUF418)